MPAIVKELTIAVTPARVFIALTQQDQIAHWWTDDLNIKPEVGSIAEFRFHQQGTYILQFEVLELDADENISWASRQGPPQWVGTTVTWQLLPAQNGTRLVFTHDGFTRVDAVYTQTRKNWEYVLGCLKSYLETGG